MASKIAQDSRTWFNIANDMPPRRSKTALIRLHMAKEPPKEAPERPTSFKHLKQINDFCLLVFFASDGLLRPQDGSKMAQETPKSGPRMPQDGPTSAQVRPKSAPRGPFEGPDGGTLKGPTLFFDRWPPILPQEAPRNARRALQEGPKKYFFRSRRGALI